MKGVKKWWDPQWRSRGKYGLLVVEIIHPIDQKNSLRNTKKNY